MESSDNVIVMWNQHVNNSWVFRHIW